jgi:hypothetical protein
VPYAGVLLCEGWAVSAKVAVIAGNLVQYSNYVKSVNIKAVFVASVEGAKRLGPYSGYVLIGTCKDDIRNFDDVLAAVKELVV